MSRIQVIHQEVFKFEELSQTAKDKATQHFSDDIDSSDVYEDAATIADLMGIDLRTRKSGNNWLPCIYYSGFWSQGDGACFEGTYRYRKDSKKLVREYAGQDTELHRIVDALFEVQKRNFYRLRASMKHSGHYYHSGCMDVHVEDYENQYRDLGDSESEIRQLMRDFADWIYEKLEEDYEYQTSEECIAELCELNNFEFTKDGELA